MSFAGVCANVVQGPCRVGEGPIFGPRQLGLLAEVPAAISALKVARIWIEVRAMDAAAIAVPRRAPRWGSVRSGPIGWWRWRRCNVDCLRRKGAANDGSDPQSQ